MGPYAGSVSTLPTPTVRRLVTAARRRVDALKSELAKFGTIGVVNAALDIALFNVLNSAVGMGPLSAKALATTVAATSSYFMNRHWTWKDRARTGLAREYRMFILLSAVGLAIAEACLLVSHYLLGLTHPLWDNLSANGVGLVLGTIWRFWSFKKWVFLPVEPDERATRDAAAAAAV